MARISWDWRAASRATGLLLTLGQFALCSAAEPAKPGGCSRPITAPISAPASPRSPARMELVLNDVLEGSGCKAAIQVVPRLRQYRMFFDDGVADMFFGATRSASREAVAEFIPMLTTRPAIITTGDAEGMPETLEDLRNRTNWRGVVVESYYFGDAYAKLVADLKSANRVESVVSPDMAMKMLHARRVQFALLPAAAAWAQHHEQGIGGFEKLHIRPLDITKGAEIGVYLSRANLGADDRTTLKQWLEGVASSGRMRQIMRKHYPADVIALDFGFLEPPPTTKPAHGP